MNWSVALPILVSGVLALAGWLVKTLFFDAIQQLRAADQRQGERFGKDVEDIRAWQTAHDAVEKERERVRRRADTRGVPVVRDDET